MILNIRIWWLERKINQEISWIVDYAAAMKALEEMRPGVPGITYGHISNLKNKLDEHLATCNKLADKLEKLRDKRNALNKPAKLPA